MTCGSVPAKKLLNKTKQKQMLKRIPNENPEEIRKKVARKARRFIAAGPGFSSNVVITSKVQLKKREETKKDRGIIKEVCVKLIRFAKGNGGESHEEVSDLIYGMKRSVLSLERERLRIIQEQKRKNKGG